MSNESILKKQSEVLVMKRMANSIKNKLFKKERYSDEVVNIRTDYINKNNKIIKELENFKEEFNQLYDDFREELKQLS